MKLSSKLRGNLLLLLTACIWGFSFVAQAVGMEHVGPYTFNAVRFLMGGAVLLPFVWRSARRKSAGEPDGRRAMLAGGALCGLALFAAAAFQQLGIQTTSPGKAGFITSLSIVIVPLFGLLLKRKQPALVWAGVLLAAGGVTLLCAGGDMGFSRGDVLLLLCAVGFSVHVLVVDRFSPKADSIALSCIQFFVSGIASLVLAFALEKPAWAQLAGAWAPLLYSGILSCGVAYTLQIAAQRDTDPTVVTLILSLESVFALLGGGLLLHQWPTLREAAGCALLLAATILAQADPRSLRKRGQVSGSKAGGA